MATQKTRMINTTHALPLMTLAATLFLAACDSSQSTKVGNSTDNIGESGSQPRSGLTFSVDPKLENNGHSSPGESALRSTLSSTAASSFEDLQVLVFGPVCSGCHIGGGVSQPSVMDLTTTDASYSALTNSQGSSSPASTLVVPGNADNSYLVHLIEGTQATGPRMPMRSAPLSDELVIAVRAWINQGAQR